MSRSKSFTVFFVGTRLIANVAVLMLLKRGQELKTLTSSSMIGFHSPGKAVKCST